MFDPAKHPELKNSPRLAAIKEVFKAIATGKPALEVRKMAAKLMTELNAVERELLQSQRIIEKELGARDGIIFNAMKGAGYCPAAEAVNPAHAISFRATS